MEYEVQYEEVTSRTIDRKEIREFIESILNQGGSVVHITEPYVWSDTNNIVNRRFGIFWKKPKN